MRTTMTMRAALLLTALAVTGSVTGCEDGATAPNEDLQVASVQVNSAGPLVVGDTVRLSAEARAADGSVVLGRVASWAVDDPSVLELSGVGASVRVRAVAPGSTRVLATVSGVTGHAAVTVSGPWVT